MENENEYVWEESFSVSGIDTGDFSLFESELQHLCDKYGYELKGEGVYGKGNL